MNGIFSVLGCVVLAGLFSSCMDAKAATVQLFPKRVDLDEQQKFRLELRNGTDRVVSIGKAKASCPCAKLDPHPEHVPAGSSAVLTGSVDLNSAPDSVGISVFVDGVRHSARVLTSTAAPKWDREIVYRVGVKPGQSGEFAGVYFEGSREGAGRQRENIEIDVPHVVGHEWGEIRPVEGRKSRFFSELRLQLDKDLGKAPITGLIRVGGSPIQVVLVPRASSSSSETAALEDSAKGSGR